jgi:hypothetical protein
VNWAQPSATVLKPTAPGTCSDRASVTTVPPPSGRSGRTTLCHLPSWPPHAGHAAPPPRAPPLSPLTLIRCEHQREGKARLIFPTRNSSVASAFPRRLPLLQCRALPRQPPSVGLCQGDLLEHRPNLDPLPEPLVAARSRPQATLRCCFFRREHLSMDRLVRSSSNPTGTTTSSARALRRSPTPPSSPARAPTTRHRCLLRPNRAPPWDRIYGEPSSLIHL